MIKESCENEDVVPDPDFSARTMFLMAVATSIDALAVGVSFAVLSVDIWSAVTIIGVTTFILSVVGLKIGNIFGSRYKNKAEFLGGAILLTLGVKILIEHTCL
jgi:putative Mn2+ efflux pump MntP